MLQKIYKYRFELFLLSQLSILFGSLIMPAEAYEAISLLLFYVNILLGSLFFQSSEKTNYWKLILSLVLIGGVFGLSAIDKSNSMMYNYIKVIILFLFHLLITFKLITQVWNASLVNKKVIYGLITGFISLGLVGFFICISIEIIDPGSFSGLSGLGSSNTITERLLYFSYITLLTIGYGDIIPLSHLSQKASVLIGLSGQFYLVIITGIIVGKFINQSIVKENSNEE